MCAGSPCTNLSVSGNRQGLKGQESGLFYEFIRVVREMRKATNGEYPKFIVWENVPGAFSTNKGNDFRVVLEEITKTKIPIPKSGRWANTGMVRSRECEVAWRVLDAQYFGTPQRRKRIFLVADFRTNGKSAGEILFVEKGLPGNTNESRKERKGITSDTKESVRDASTVEIYDIAQRSDVARPQKNGTIPTMTARYGTGGNNIPIVVKSVTENHDGNVFESNHIGSLTTGGGKPGQGYPCICFEPGVATRDGGHIYTDNKAPTLRANPGDNFPAVYSIEGTGFRPSHNGKGWNDDGVAPTLNTVERHAVAVNKTIRKLTPLEAERLQGMEDNYTLIDDKTCSDSARYKALGNGMAIPCSDYVIQRIVEVVNNGKV